jgi:hypothetical protein
MYCGLHFQFRWAHITHEIPYPVFECTGCLIFREFRIQSVVGKDPVELEKYLEKKFALPEEDIK